MSDEGAQARALVTRRSAVIGAGACALTLPVFPAAAETYPAKPVRVLVAYAPGGGADTLARLFFGTLAEQLGTPFIVDNRAGGGGTIAAGLAAKAAADGYTVFHDATGFSINPALVPQLPYDASRDFAPVFLAGTLPLLIVVHPSLAIRSVPDLIAHAKAAPEGLNWGSAGNGSVQHLALEMFAHMAGVRLNHIPYKGGGPAMNDMLGGHIKFYFANTATIAGHLKSGALRAIAHCSTGKIGAFPELPAVADTVPGFTAFEWNGVFLPAGTPREIVLRLNAVLNGVLAHAGAKERLAQLSVETRANSPEEFGAFVAAEMSKWAKVIKDANIKLE